VTPGAHTPGPWAVSLESPEIVIYNGRIVAECRSIGPVNQYQYNARLIAAAPDLLAALVEAECLVSTLEDGEKVNGVRLDEVAATIRAAILSATTPTTKGDK